MSFGQQAVQSMHALRQFTAEYPSQDQSWFENSNYLGLLSVSSEKELMELMEKASSQGIRFSVFKEPDIEEQITAVAFEPSQKTKKLCSRLKLALRN